MRNFALYTPVATAAGNCVIGNDCYIRQGCTTLSFGSIRGDGEGRR